MEVKFSGGVSWGRGRGMVGVWRGGGEGYKFFWGGLMSCLRIGGWKLGFGGGGGE